MSGSRIGGLKARDAIRKKNPDHWKEIGAVGGKKGTTGGFGQGEKGKELARKAGAVGGRKSKRTATTYFLYKGEMRSANYIMEHEQCSRQTVYNRYGATGTKQAPEKHRGFVDKLLHRGN